MKKIMTMMMALFCLILASCGSSVDPKAVAEKIASGQPLTEADYSAMIDYCSNYAQKAQPYFDIVNSGATTDSKEYADATNSLAEMMSKAVYLDTFRNAIENATSEQLGKANVEKVKEFSKLEAFPIPAVSDSIMLNPDVVGDIEDMPATDSNGVIANGDGEVVVAK